MLYEREAMKGLEAKVRHEPIYLIVISLYHEENRLKGKEQRDSVGTLLS